MNKYRKHTYLIYLLMDFLLLIFNVHRIVFVLVFLVFTRLPGFRVVIFGDQLGRSLQNPNRYGK